MSRKVEICGVDTSTLPKLSAEEALNLLVMIKENGDEEAKQLFINANLRLVLSIVQRFASDKISSDDLFQVGCVGLLKAINNFDISMNVMFSTYAVPMIIGEIKRFLRDANSLKISRKIRDVAYRALKTREQMISDGKLEPQLFEIAEEIDVSVREITAALDAVSDPLSLYECVYGDGDDGMLLVEQLCDANNNEGIWIDEVQLKDAIKILPEKERAIILLRYFIGKTQIEIADELQISQAQVSRLEKSALNKMKTKIE